MSGKNGRIAEAVRLTRTATQWTPTEQAIVRAAAAEILGRADPNEAERRALARFASAGGLEPKDRDALQALEDRAEVGKPEARVVAQAWKFSTLGPSRAEPEPTEFDADIAEAQKLEDEAMAVLTSRKDDWHNTVDAERAVAREAATTNKPNRSKLEAARARIREAEAEYHAAEDAWLRRRAKKQMLQQAAARQRVLAEYERTRKR